MLVRLEVLMEKVVAIVLVAAISLMVAQCIARQTMGLLGYPVRLLDEIVRQEVSR